MWQRMRARLRALVNWRRRASDLDEELRFHLDADEDERREAGANAAEARRAARLDFGNLAAVAEDTRATWGWTGVEPLLRDIRYAARTLSKSRAFTTTVVLSLALGIGATTAMFTVVDGVLLRPLPYRDPDRLVQLLYGHQGRVSPWFSPLNLRDYVYENDAFSAAAAVSPTTANMTGAGDPERLRGASVSLNFFQVLGVSMARGRTFVEADTQDAGHEIVLSHGLWQRRFGGRPDVIGTTTVFDGRAVTIVGIAPADLKFPATAEFWQPLVFTPRDMAPETRGRQWVHVLARLSETVSVELATSSLERAAARLALEFPVTEKDATVLATPLHERMVGDIRPALLQLFGAVTLVLLITCANVAGLLLARTQSRGREISVRAALGASRRRLMVQLLVESLLLGLAGAAAGVGVAHLLVRALVMLGPASIPRLADLGVNVDALGFALATAIVTSIAFGLTPAVWCSKWLTDGSAALKSRGVAGTSGTRSRRLLVVAELAIAVVLLAGAGLLLRSYAALQQVEPGFEPDGVVTFTLSLPAEAYGDSGRREAFVSTLISRLAAEADVERAAVVKGLPFTRDLDLRTGFRLEDRAESESATMPSASMRIVSADYFSLMRIPLHNGRLFTDRDNATSPAVALINERAAQRFFPGANPVGQRIRVSAELARQMPGGSKTIVGVIGDVKHGGLDEESPAEIYLPYGQHQVDAFSVVVRPRAGALPIIPAVRRSVGELDSGLPLANLTPITTLIDASVAERRFMMLLFLAFAAIAVGLSVVGVYGVLSRLVSHRTKEIGVRLAVGASASNVVWLLVREVAMLGIVGLAAGLIGALTAGRWIAASLFQVTPSDPVTFVGVICVLALAAVAATYLPARRAARVDPMVALRAE